MSSPLTMQYLQASVGGLSLERLLDVAHATGELVLTCRNLKSFPKHRCKYDLKDTVSVGKKNLPSKVCNANQPIPIFTTYFTYISTYFTLNYMILEIER